MTSLGHAVYINPVGHPWSFSMFLGTSVRTIEPQDEGKSQEEAETPNDLDGRRLGQLRPWK